MELLAQVRLQLVARARLPPSTSRSHMPRYSSRIQLSIRLAVAASGSALALETAAHNARLPTLGLGWTLTATNLA